MVPRGRAWSRNGCGVSARHTCGHIIQQNPWPGLCHSAARNRPEKDTTRLTVAPTPKLKSFCDAQHLTRIEIEPRLMENEYRFIFFEGKFNEATMSSTLSTQQDVPVVDPSKAASEARASLRKRQLLSAAARLMARDGADAVSMQALATEASVSVGLIYRYFGNKEDLLLAVIVEVLDAFDAQVPAAIAAAGADPVERIAAAFASYCSVINDHRDAAVLSYRESKSLGAAGRDKIKDLEISTVEPLKQAVLEAIEAGRLVRVDAELFAYNLLLLAHAWALKRWYFERSFDFDTYVRKQTAVALAAVVQAEHRPTYSHLLDLS